MEQSIFVVPDTNIFLHCKALGELPWGLLTQNEVEIVLVDAVLAELDHWKDQGNDRRAKRVRSLLPTLRKLAGSEQDVVDLCPGPPRIRLRLDSRTSPVSKTDNDAAIIDATEKIQERTGGHVLVLTRDVLLALRCKRRGMSCFLISPEDDEWNAQPERPDPELSELKRELEELKRQRPSIEMQVDTLGGSVTKEAITILLPKITGFERIDFVSRWAHKYFEEHDPRNSSRGWDFDDSVWKRDLDDLDIKLRKALARRIAGATIWLTVINSGSVNAEDVRIEVLADGPWLLARSVANLSFQVPRPLLKRIYDASTIFVPPLPRFDTPVFDPVDPSVPVWEAEEQPDQPQGVSRLAIRIPILRHRDEVDVPFRLGTNADAGPPGKLIVRVSTEKTPKPIVRTFHLECETLEVSTHALIDWLIERKELEIAVKSRAR